MSLFSKRSSKLHGSGPMFPWSHSKLTDRKGTKMLPRLGHTCTLMDDHLIVFGGIHKKKLAKKHVYTININTLSIQQVKTSGDDPEPRTDGTMVTIGPDAVLFGGETATSGQYDASVYLLDTHQYRWTQYPHLENGPCGRSGHSAAVQGQTVYIWGGRTGSSYHQDLYKLSVRPDLPLPRWELIQPQNQGPTGRAGHASVVLDNMLYIFGGTDTAGLYGDIWSFNLDTRVWTSVPTVGYTPVPRELCSVSVVGNIMYIFGGLGPNQKELDDLYALKLNSMRWYIFQNMGKPPSPRYGHTLTAVDERIFVIGGDSSADTSNDLSEVYILDCAKIKYPPEKLEEAQMPPQPVQSQPQVSQGSIVEVQHPHDISDESGISHSIPARSSLQHSIDKRSEPNLSNEQLIPVAPSHTTTANGSITDREAYMNGHLSAPSPVNAPSPTPTSSITSTLHSTREVTPAVAPVITPLPPPRGMRATKVDISALMEEQRSHNELAMNSMNTPQPGPDKETSSTATLVQATFAPSSTNHGGGVADEEYQTMVRNLRARDNIIKEMKKKEQWWRTEVSIARRDRMKRGDPLETGSEVDEARLLQFDSRNQDAYVLLESLVAAKTEIRQAKSSITRLEEPMRRLQTAALAEAAYYKAKCEALEQSDMEMLRQLEHERARDLERRLTIALRENESNGQLLQQLQRRTQEDQKLRLMTEQRALAAEKQSKDVQDAHVRVLTELEASLQRATEAEGRERDYVAKLADLTTQLSESLQRGATREDHGKTQIEISRLEVQHAMALEEVHLTKRRLEESMDDIARLRMLLNERDDALIKSRQHLEEVEVELALIKKSEVERHQEELLTF